MGEAFLLFPSFSYRYEDVSNGADNYSKFQEVVNAMHFKLLLGSFLSIETI